MINSAEYLRAQKTITPNLGKSGRILNWTVIHTSTDEFSDQVPYPVVLIEISKDDCLLLQLVDYESRHLVIGQSVVCVLRKTYTPQNADIISYCLKAKPTVL